MGSSFSSNTNSNSAEHKNFAEIMDFIATHYILTSDFKSMVRLTEKEYCDKLIVLTSGIIQRYFTDTEIQYLAQRIKNGEEVNQMNTENIIYINRDKLDELDASNGNYKNVHKKRLCIAIAQFYIKIAHIFSAIMTTINPVYTYKNSMGEDVQTAFLDFDKDQIPSNVPKTLTKINICDARIQALKKGEFVNKETETYTIQPDVCDMNVKADGSVKTLEDEPGIPELMQLYLDDDYDYSTGTFRGMTESTRNTFQKDLRKFYIAFTGEEMPPNIQKFSDIKLRNYASKKGCQKPKLEPALVPESIPETISNTPQESIPDTPQESIPDTPQESIPDTPQESVLSTPQESIPNTAQEPIPNTAQEPPLQNSLPNPIPTPTQELNVNQPQPTISMPNPIPTQEPPLPKIQEQTTNSIPNPISNPIPIQEPLLPNPIPTQESNINQPNVNQPQPTQSGGNNVPIYRQSYTGSTKDKLFVDYANNITNMINTASTNQQNLLEIINVLFSYTIDPYTNKKVIRVNPKLNLELLNMALYNTRKIITKLYVQCEMSYNEGIDIFEAIVASQMLETTREQIKTLETESEDLLTENNNDLNLDV